MNQILVTEKLYVTPELKRKKKIYKIQFLVSIVAILLLFSYYIYAEVDKHKQESISQEILGQLKEVDDTITNDSMIVVALDDRNDSSVVEQPIEMPIDTPAQNNEPITEKTTLNGQQYTTEAIVSYPSLGINYPVLSETSDELLKVSVTKYWGPAPNQVGNYCVVGHNYKSGKLFGKLNQSKIGDEVQVKDLSGNIVKYSVYNKYVVDPTDVSCTSQLTNGKREVTLITCTSLGSQRLVIKAREI